jgi:hypothetical protein
LKFSSVPSHEHNKRWDKVSVSFFLFFFWDRVLTM